MSLKEAEVVPKKEEKKEEAPKKPLSLLEELRNEVLQIEKGIAQNDIKTVLKVTKGMRRFKKYLKAHHFAKIWAVVFPTETDIKFESFPDYDSTFEETFDLTKKKAQKLSKLPEFDFFFRILLLSYFLQVQKVDDAYELAGKLFSRVSEINKKHFDQLSSLVYYFYVHTRELKGQISEIREELFEAYRGVCLKHNELAQATLINAILRNYLHYNNYEQAQHFVSKISFPEHVSNNETIRFLYYTGRIKAVQAEYQDAHNYLNQALRKAPESSGLGFRLQAQKLSIIVEFLLGNIPSREVFMKQEYWNPLYPYYKIVQSVLKGNLSGFSQVAAQFQTQFTKDKNYSLIQRLEQTVIKTGLKKINLSYSRISLADIAEKLNLPADSDVEFIVAKAIRDGILNAKINHEKQYITIKLENDIYSSNKPQEAFQKRISYCMSLYNSATKALQYPDTNYQIENKSDDEGDDLDEEIDIYKIMEEED